MLVIKCSFSLLLYVVVVVRRVVQVKLLIYFENVLPLFRSGPYSFRLHSKRFSYSFFVAEN